MFLINKITSDAKQNRVLLLADGKQVTFNIEYKPLQEGWFITKLVYGDFELDGARIVVSPNMLHQYRNLLPFGLCCQTNDGQEPTLQKSFSSGYANLYLLSAAEVVQFTEYLSGQV